jgi:hypothetical protein
MSTLSDDEFLKLDGKVDGLTESWQVGKLVK